MEKEVWKEFEYGTKIYKISNYGNLLNENNYSVSQRSNYDGYLVVTLWNGQRSKEAKMHRLVAKNFVENLNDGTEVNHIDFNRQNNYYKNLEWCTHTENIQKSIDAGRMHYQTSDISGENNNNYGNRKLSKIYADDKNLAKEKQSRPGSQNGRCIPIRMIGNGIDVYFDYLGKCAEFLVENVFNKEKNIVSLSTRIKNAAQQGKQICGFNFYIGE
jgi:hypothetical protein